MRACRHCGLPVPASRARDFCCAGCEAVHDLLAGSGLEAFYRLGRGATVGAVPQPGRHDWLPEILAAGALPDGTVRVQLDVQGVRCAACVWLLQELWRRRAGALRIHLNPALGRVELRFDSRLPLSAWIDDVERLGYRIGPASKQPAAVERGLLLRTGVCVALALNAMMFALACYTGMTAADGPVHALFQRLSFGIGTLAFLVGAPPFLRAAWSGLALRVLHLDLPIALGLLLSYLSSVWLYLRTGEGGYFDTVTVFVALMLLGRWLQQRAVRRNRDYLLRNDGADHLRARLVVGGALRPVPIRALATGQRLWLAPGDLLPADGRLQHRPAAFSLDWIHGESLPRRFAAGDTVPAGAFLSGQEPAELEVVRSAEDSGLLALLCTPDLDRDRVAGRFWRWLNRGYALGVLLLAAAAAATWALLDPSRVIEVVTALLVVTCPCAVGIATPLAFDLVLAGLRRRGVFVRRASLLDKARAVRRICFDKTGTLTWGRAVARELRAPPAEVHDLLFTLAAASSHPASRAIADALPAGRLLAGVEPREVPGAGVEVRHQGSLWRLGSAQFVLGEAVDRDGATCWLGRDGAVHAAYVIDEELRDDAAGEIRRLARAGYEIVMLSGDRRARALRVAARAGIDQAAVHADLRPEQKAALIAAGDPAATLMVGDGLNDALAFDAAACAGTPALERPVLPARADFCWSGSGIAAVRALLEWSGRFHRVVRRNLGLSSLYNAAAVTLAFAGLMTPVLCAVLMPLSSLCLLAHTSLSLASGPDPATD